MAIHPTAVVEDGAELGNDVEIGAMAYIGPNVKIGDGCRIDHHASIEGLTTIGKENRFFPHCSVGTAPQDLTYHPEQQSKLKIGDHNLVREFVTINGGTIKEPEQTTFIGNHCMFMANVHIAHDSVLGNHIIMANNCLMGGHVRIGDHVNFGGFVGLHHFVSIGEYSFIGGWSRIRQDAPPYLISEGVPQEVRNLNFVGLRRAEVSEEAIAELRSAFKAIFRSDLILSTAIRHYEDEHPNPGSKVAAMLGFMKNRMEGPSGRYLESVLRK